MRLIIGAKPLASLSYDFVTVFSFIGIHFLRLLIIATY